MLFFHVGSYSICVVVFLFLVPVIVMVISLIGALAKQKVYFKTTKSVLTAHEE